MTKILCYSVLATLLTLNAAFARTLLQGPSFWQQSFLGELNEQCKDNSTSADTLAMAITNFKLCLDITFSSMYLARADDAYTVINKYCSKRSMVLECANNFIVDLEQCLNGDYVTFKNTFNNITVKVTDLLCNNHGVQLLVFINYNGVECVQSKADALLKCYNNIYGSKETNEISDSTLPGVRDECSDIKDIQECLVNELQSCPDPNHTSANLFSSFMNIVRNEQHCSNLTDPDVSNIISFNHI